MAVTLLASLLIDGATDPGGGALITAPVPAYWYWLDAVWGSGAGDNYNAYATSLGGLVNCTEWVGNLGYAPGTRTGVVLPANASLFLLPFQPDGVAAYLGKGNAACGRWRIQFPASGAASLNLAGSTLTWTVAIAAAVVYPNVYVLDDQPLGAIPARTVSIAWLANYPVGGIQLPSTFVGLAGPLWASINDVAGYRFVWTAGVLHAYAAGGGEIASGTAINFTTSALFIGAAA